MHDEDFVDHETILQVNAVQDAAFEQFLYPFEQITTEFLATHNLQLIYPLLKIIEHILGTQGTSIDELRDIGDRCP